MAAAYPFSWSTLVAPQARAQMIACPTNWYSRKCRTASFHPIYLPAKLSKQKRERFAAKNWRVCLVTCSTGSYRTVEMVNCAVPFVTIQPASSHLVAITRAIVEQYKKTYTKHTRMTPTKKKRGRKYSIHQRQPLTGHCITWVNGSHAHRALDKCAKCTCWSCDSFGT